MIFLPGQIRSIFVVLSDDQFRKVLGTLKKPRAAPSAANSSDTIDSEDTQSTEPASGRGNSSRNHKRGASSAAKGPPPKK